ncbi:sulfotransferase family protein [Actinomadura terrae]|uniref:sulfotransferase family protein n=1 Tax=Actinomadura terrae TaxID=604353 RepID=UPI001FA78A82|nr:sulfotransferase family protein [Actinomadura terrae]
MGFGRTGTLSLKAALEELGFGPCHHMLTLVREPARIAMWQRASEQAARGNAVDWDALYAGYGSAVDWPGVRYWRELVAHFATAKVILTVRDADRWYASARRTIYANAQIPRTDPASAARRELNRRVVWDGQFDGRFADEQHATEVFTRHNEAVRQEVEPHRLLVYETGQGWRPLCEFLNAPVPATPFPWLNSRETFADLFPTD